MKIHVVSCICRSHIPGFNYRQMHGPHPAPINLFKRCPLEKMSCLIGLAEAYKLIAMFRQPGCLEKKLDPDLGEVEVKRKCLVKVAGRDDCLGGF